MTASAPTRSPARPISPYKGLAPFEDTELDALLFFGRERDREIVAANLVAARLTILYGTSGVGKSSLLRAAVARDLRGLPEEPLVVAHDSWLDEPVAAVSAAIGVAAGVAGTSTLGDAAEVACALHNELYVILDQLEELFVYHPGRVAEEFGRALGELVGRLDLPVHVLLGVRDDALARLDAFKGQVPGLLANRVRLDHLDREAGHRAIVGPVERFGALVPEEEGLAVEPALVAAVLDGVRTGELAPGARGRGVAKKADGAQRVEAPYLQLVMQRLWEVERADGSRVLRRSTLERLGGPRRIVEEHLERALAALTPAQKALAARMFNHLVTPSGTKISHEDVDLAEYAAASEGELQPVLGVLGRERILRAVSSGDGAAHEIYHDVLADAVLAWRARFDAEQALERERAITSARHRRLLALLIASFVALGALTGLTVYAFAKRSDAREQRASALAAARYADRQRRIAVRQEEAAKLAGRKEKAQRVRAQQATERAQHEKVRADERAADADASARAADEARGEADVERRKAVAAKQDAVAFAHEANRQKRIAQHKTTEARKSAAEAQAATGIARARALTEQAASLLAIDPDLSLQLALQAAKQERSVRIERVLRQAIVAERARRVLPGGGGDVRAVAYTPDGGKALVASSDGAAKIFDTASGRALGTVQHGGFLSAAALSPDGTTFVTAGRGGTARLWSVATLAPVAVVQQGDVIRCVAFSPDSRTLATGGNDGFVRFWDARTGEALFALRHPFAVERISFDSSGRRLLAVARDAYVWDTTTRARIALLDQPGQIKAAAFSPDASHVVTGGLDDVAKIWDVGSQTAEHTLRGHGLDIVDVAYSPSGEYVITASADSSARVWRADTGEGVAPLFGHTNQLTRVVFRLDGHQVATLSADGTIRLWTAEFSLATILLGHLTSPTVAAYSPDGTSLLTGSTDGSARIWKSEGNPFLRVLGERTRAVHAAAFDPTGRLTVSGGVDGIVHVRRLNGTEVLSVDEKSTINDVRYSPDGRFILVALETGEARLRKAADGVLVRTFAHGAAVRASVFDRSGDDVLTVGADGIARLWDASTGAPLRTFRHGGTLLDAAFSPDGSLVATAGDDDVIRLWRRSGALDRKLTGHTDAVTSVAFSRDGRLLVSASRDHDGRIWNVKTGETIRVLRAHTAVVSDANFSPDGRWVVTAGPVTVGLWETATGRRLDPGAPLYYLRGPTIRVRTAVFDPAGVRILSASDDGTVRSYLCELCGTQAQLVRLGERRLQRLTETLSPGEQRHYLGVR